MTADVSAPQTVRRKRSIAWIYYALLALVGVIAGFQAPVIFVAALACGAYSAYLFWARPHSIVLSWRCTPAFELRENRCETTDMTDRRAPYVQSSGYGQQLTASFASLRITLCQASSRPKEAT